MKQHIQGAVQFVSNNHLKFDGPSEAIPALPDPGQTFGYVNKAVPQPAPKEVLLRSILLPSCTLAKGFSCSMSKWKIHDIYDSLHGRNRYGKKDYRKSHLGGQD